MGIVDLTDREWDVLALIRERVPPHEMADRLGITPQGRSNILGRLKRKGVITPVAALPAGGDYTERYPWEVDRGVDVRYKPAVPPTAVLRAGYAHESTSDRSVPPIKVVRWPAGGWEVQGIPTLRRGGGKPSNVIPTDRLVWCIAPRPIREDSTGEPKKNSIAFDVPLGFPWMETHTAEEFDRVALREGECVALTLMIAAVCAVPAVLDVSRAGWRDTGGLPF